MSNQAMETMNTNTKDEIINTMQAQDLLNKINHNSSS